MPRYAKKIYRKKRTNKKALVSLIKSVVHKTSELKHIDFLCNEGTAYLTPIVTSWKELALFGSIAQGVGYNNRIGNKISVKGIECNMVLTNFNNQLGTSDYYNHTRMVVGLYDGSTLTPLATAGLALDQPLAKYNCVDLKKILKQKWITLVPQYGSTSSCGADCRVIKFFIPFKKGLKVDFTSGNPHINCVVSMRGDSPVAPNPGVTNGWIRVHYTDF